MLISNISQTQTVTSKKQKLVKDEKPTDRRNSKGRFFIDKIPGFFKGKKHTKKSKRKMSKARKKYFENPENRKNMSIKMTGKKQSKKSIEKKSIKLKMKWVEDKEWAEKRKRDILRISKTSAYRKAVSESLKGKPKSKAHIKKVSEAIKKKWQNPEYKAKMLKANNTKKMKRIRSQNSSGKNNAMYGKNGRLSPNWNGGISFEPYSPEFNKRLKETIKKRDNYTCRLCGEKQFLHTHHIDYNKKNSIESNLITLCRKCNGKANFNRNFWTEKFRIMLEASY